VEKDKWFNIHDRYSNGNNNFFFLFSPFYYNLEIVVEVLLVQGSLLEKKEKEIYHRDFRGERERVLDF